VHETNGMPHVAITAYIAVIFLIAAGLEVWTGPLNTFGDAGTLAAFGFLLAYFLTAIAAPFYLAKRRELRARHVGFAVLAVLCLLVPTVGSFYPVPAFPTNIFPYIFLGYLAAGGAWLFAVSRRQPGLLADIETDLEQTLEADQEHTAAARGAHAPASPGLLPGLVADAAD